MQEKKERNDVQHHIKMFANGIGSQNWQRTHPYRPGNSVRILAYISLEYFVLSFRSTRADEYKNDKLPSEQFLMYFSVEYFQ